MFLSACAAFFAWTAFATAKQQVLGTHQFHNESLFTPAGSLSVLSDDFATLAHPAFPRYSVRIKKSNDFCDKTVNSYTGYIDIEARHLFFYFFESRNDPDKDDVIFWTNGGPGSSSSLGLFMELGPCRVDANGTKFHPESWNSNANIFFIDQPIGVGFSYAEYGETVGTTEEAAKDIAAFVAIFFQHFSKFQSRPFHMAGESYAGQYIPLFASEVYDQNRRLVEAGLSPINLKSVMIGNGLTDPFRMAASYYDVACTPASVAPVLGIATCVRMKQTLPRCLKMLQESCIDIFDTISCSAAALFCHSELSAPMISSGKNPYDISKECEGKLDDTLCYSATKLISSYLNRPSVRAQIGVDAAIGNFSDSSDDVNKAFTKNLDMYRIAHPYIAALLERGIQALIYVGKNDWICNHVGNEAWTLAMEWSGHDEFAEQPLREWNVDGKPAGMTRSAKGLTYATIDGAGHLVPYDKPKESLELVKRWLSGSPI